MDKTSVLKTFNNILDNYLDFLENLFPNNYNIKVACTSLKGLKKINPKLLIQIWKVYIYDKYYNDIECGNFNYFINKDYKEDLVDMYNNKDILKQIDELKEPISKSSEENKNKSIKFMQQLTKLSNIYYIS